MEEKYMTTDIREKVFTNAVKPKLEERLKTVGENLSALLSDFSFLFDNNKELLLTLIVDHYLQGYDNQSNTFHLDFQSLSKSTPVETKEKLFEQVIMKFINTVDITRQKDNLEKETLFEDNDNHETNNTTSSELKDELPI